MPKKRKITKEDKAKIIDLSARGFSRTSIAKIMHMKNVTLEKLCKENDIKLPQKGSFTYIKYNANGVALIKKRNTYFNNLSQLYLLLMLNHRHGVTNITPYEDTYKAIENGEIKIYPLDRNQKATNEMIKNAVDQGMIRFMNPYYNNKFGVKNED